MKKLLVVISVIAFFLLPAVPVAAAPTTITVFSAPGIDAYGPIFSSDASFVPNVDDPSWGDRKSAVAVSNPAWAIIPGATWISTNAIVETAPAGTEGSWRKFHAKIDVDVPVSARYLEGTLLVLTDNAVSIYLNGDPDPVRYWGNCSAVGSWRIYPRRGVNDLYFLVKNTAEQEFPSGGNPTGVAFKVIIGYYSPLGGQYSVVTETEYLGQDSWEFTYIITNLTEIGDYTGLPYTGIDHTGLDGFFLDVPDDAVIHDVVVPPPYKTEPGVGWTFYPGGWIGIWGDGAQSIYPLGEPLVFKFRADNVTVGTTDATLTTYFYDQAMRYPGEYNLVYQSYYTQITGPVPLGPQAERPPEQQIENIQDWFDDAVTGEDLLVGAGPGSSADGRLKALRNMLERAEELIADGLTAEARQQLEAAYKRVDHNPKPPDFATGSEADTLAGMIRSLTDSLGSP